MRRRRILGLAMIGIGLLWLTGQFFDGGNRRGRGWEDDWEANAENWERDWERNLEHWEANVENWERNWEDREGIAAPVIPEMPELPPMPDMPDMPPMPHFEGHNGHWFGWWKLPLLLIGAMLLLTMRRRARFGNGENYHATVHRF